LADLRRYSQSILRKTQTVRMRNVVVTVQLQQEQARASARSWLADPFLRREILKALEEALPPQIEYGSVITMAV